VEIQRIDLGTVTVECLHADRCNGELTLRLTRRVEILKNGASATMLDAARVDQTCTCDHAEDDRERLVDRARWLVEQR
jgi:hypothetical protein